MVFPTQDSKEIGRKEESCLGINWMIAFFQICVTLPTSNDLLKILRSANLPEGPKWRKKDYGILSAPGAVSFLEDIANTSSFSLKRVSLLAGVEMAS